jgi:hypothetical protein
MKKNLLYTCLTLISVSNALAQESNSSVETKAGVAEINGSEGPIKRRSVPDTIMFTIDEFTEIKDREAGGEITEIEKAKQLLEASTLYLNSIMYYGPKSWTIWINGQPIGPGQDFQSFQVTEINTRFVELLVPLSVKGMRPVRLEPNQTFIAESGIIVEGKYP